MQISSGGVLKGALAGFIATAPMTASMRLMRRQLPWWQQGPLPPHEVTSRTLNILHQEKLDARYHDEATFTSHFAYGAMSGMLYPLIHRLPFPTSVNGIICGMIIWTGSYMGWIPASGLLRPATARPAQRNLLMILAHCVWGIFTSVLFRAIPTGRGLHPESRNG